MTWRGIAPKLLVAVNDLAPAEELVYLLKRDSVYGRYGRDVRAENGRLVVDGQSCVALTEKSVDKLPWRDLTVDIEHSAELVDVRGVQR